MILIIVLLLGCEPPFDTNPSAEDSYFNLTASHSIERIVDYGLIHLEWSEISVENFQAYRLEAKSDIAEAWIAKAQIADIMQVTYTDTVFDDENMAYRIGIVDTDENVRWAETSIVVPKTTSLIIPDDLKSIQGAISHDLIDDGDSVLVDSGRYRTALTIIGKDILIKARDGFEETILIPAPPLRPDTAVRVVTISSGILEGFTITMGEPSHANPGGGIFLGGTGLVRNCFITENRSYGIGGGVFLTDRGRLYNNIIYANEGYQGGSGIYILNGHGEVINNTLFDNGVTVSGSVDSLLMLNNIIVNRLGPDLVLNDILTETDFLVDYSLFRPYSGLGANNISGDPEFIDFGAEDFDLDENSPCINAGHPATQYNNRDGSRNTMGAFGGPHGE